MLDGDFSERFPGIGHLPRHHFIHHDADAVYIARRGNLMALRLLRGKIVYGAHHDVFFADCSAVRHAGNAEVGYLHMPL